MMFGFLGEYSHAFRNFWIFGGGSIIIGCLKSSHIHDIINAHLCGFLNTAMIIHVILSYNCIAISTVNES